MPAARACRIGRVVDPIGYLPEGTGDCAAQARLYPRLVKEAPLTGTLDVLLACGAGDTVLGFGMGEHCLPPCPANGRSGGR